MSDKDRSSGRGRGAPPPRPGPGDRPSMLDLPLRPGSEPPRRETPPPSGPVFDPIGDEGRPPRPAPRHPRRHRSPRRRWPIWLLLVFLVAAVAWFLLPSRAEIVVAEPNLELDQARVGSEGEAREVRLTNAGERTLVVRGLDFIGEAAADFRVDGSDCVEKPLALDESCALALTFAPLTRGSRQATLEIDGKARNAPFEIAVSGLAVAPQLGLAPERLDLGGAPVDGEKASAELTISNVGALPLELGRVRISGEHAAEFRRSQRCPKTRLDPGEACTFAVEFSPRVAGERRAVLSIDNDSPEGMAEVPLLGRGLWDGPVLAADREALDFGEQRVGTRGSERAVRMRNPMPGSVTISGVEIDGAGFALSGPNCLGRTLGPGEGCSVGVAFEPAAERSNRGSLEIEASESSEKVVIRLVGRGVEPRLATETTELSFGSTRAGLRSGSQQAIFSNAGSGTLRLTRIAVRGANGGSFEVRKDACSKKGLGPKQKCAVDVVFKPAAEGAAEAELEMVPEAGLEAVRVPLSGRGVVAGLAVDRGRLDFGAVYRTRFEDRLLTMTNAGSAPLAIGGLRLQGEAADDYRLAAVGCRLDLGLAPGKSCQVSIRFTPTVDGARRARLVIDHNGPKSPAEISITGQGLAPVPVFQAAPSRFEFGALPQGRASAIATLTLSNPGAGWLSLRRIAVRGDHAEDFEIVAGTCDGATAIAPGGSCTVGLRFSPKAAGPRRGQVLVEHGGGNSPARIPLVGEGAL